MAFSFCLNTSTIRSDSASVLDMINTAADAGYDGIEPWVQELDDWVAQGGSLEQVRAHAADRNLAIVNLIGFPEWAVPEQDRREQGLEEAARCFDMARALACPYVAAPPFGIHDREVELLPIAERFAALVDLAAEYGVKPLLEYWGIARTLGHTGEVLLVAAECGRPGVQMLADVFHMYKGSGHHCGFEHFGAGRLGLLHVNDIPATPDRAHVTDADRVYPGDGLAPWPEIVATLHRIGFDGMLSLELFNEGYWAQGPEVVAREGLKKLRGCVEG
ncbi:MAG TPA: xylose isomerase [Candidatus Latescibacteria bacterium]|jgi:2-keto-myo-inositol isomerase|nr:xylose isomerase [Candidatus Latescibacterota bacterium]|tara:strand:+ start:143 stop:967 length:825 start_codon:yes stop_codon:yes gene_type:complete